MPGKKKQLSASLEDYLETIHHIVEEKQVARAKEIAARLKVSRSSVTEAFRSLSQKGLINYAPYEVITLTPAGTKAARDVIQRHRALKDFFLRVLAVDEKLAEDGACLMEHTAPRQIIERLGQLMNYLDQYSPTGDDWLQNFSRFCQSGEIPSRCGARSARNREPSKRKL